jgi:lysine N6-hydroxylase
MFEVITALGVYRSRHLSIGTGVSPKVPPFMRGTEAPNVTHSADFLGHPIPADVKNLVVVGGGQSGAEVVAHLQNVLGRKVRVDWITRRSNFLPLDESPFVEDLFTPEASEEFFHHPLNVRMRLLSEQLLASDGISDSLLERIYRRMYDIRNGYREGPAVRTRVATELTDLSVTGAGDVELAMLDRLTGERFGTHADFVVLATGYEQVLPSAVEPLLSLIPMEDGRPSLRWDFSLKWKGPPSSKIFVQNGARHVRGIADPNLSLLAWRSATIAMSIAPELAKRFLEPHQPLDSHTETSHDRERANLLAQRADRNGG